MRNINLSIHWGHDSSLCLSNDEKIIGFLEVERMNRIKSFGFKYGWRNSDDNKNFDFIVSNFLKKFGYSKSEINRVALIRTHRGDEIPKPISETFKNVDYFFFDHHEAHAAVGHYSSPFKKSIILTMDGGGNDGGLGFFLGEEENIEKIRTIGDGSIGQTWTAVRRFWSDTELGPIGTEGTLMGAAAYGKEIPELVELFTNTMENGKNVWQSFPLEIKKLFKKKFFIKKAKYQINQKYYFDFCASLQKSFDIIFKKNLKFAIKEMKKHNVNSLVLSGGCIYNCVALGKFLPKYIDNYFIPYSIDDGGLTLGSSMLLNHKIDKKSKNYKFLEQYCSPYQGFNETEKNLLENVNSRNEVKIEHTNAKCVANLISEGKVIALFNGRSESGKRALGNRSIVADPRDPNMKDRLNKKIKNRQTYRPFAPTILRDHVEEFFEQSVDSPYMNLSIKIKKNKVKLIPAVCHYDNSARLQTLDKNCNPEFYKLIEEFYKITDIPILINTSFNEFEPIVENINDAIDTFLKFEIDHIFMNDKYLISKKGSFYN